ncbi:MAG TPA: protein kinase [Anaerolineae bacterium]|nr:protein kinase [Anaerolineae bacterium]
MAGRIQKGVLVMGQVYNLAVVRQLLLSAFTAEEFRRFCLYQPDICGVCRRFGAGASLNDMVDEAINYARTRVLLDEFLAAVQAYNPRQYAQFEADLILRERKGNRIGEYKIVSEIGRGGMGVVYRAYEPSLDRHVAIKVLPPERSINEAFLARFQREARAVAMLRHPNIVVIHHVGEDRGTHYLVMELLEGRTLKEVIDEGPLPPERALQIIQQVASALDHAHQHRVVHRDVKPANVFVGTSTSMAGEHVTLTDFGIAKAATEAESLTRTGTLMGTPQYMSPEQAAGEETDHRADLYALGVVLYEMLTGRVPFQAPTPHAVLHQIIYEAPPAPRAVNPSLSPAIEAVILQAIAKQPEERFQDGASMALALRRAITEPAPAPTRRQQPARATPKTATTLAPRRVSPHLLVGGALLAVILTAMLLVSLLGGGGEDRGTPTATTAETRVAVASSPTSTPAPPTDTPTPTVEPTTEVTVAAVEEPTDTVIPTATITPTSTPTWTPTPARVPTTRNPPPSPFKFEGMFAGLWRKYSSELGCPFEATEQIINDAEQLFEHGHMFWRKDKDLIIVVYEDGPRAGRFEVHVNKWTETGIAVDNCEAQGIPANLVRPTRGMGGVWCDLGGESAAIGWAKSEEKGFGLGYTDPLIQDFEHGFIFRDSDGMTHGLAYVFFYESGQKSGTFERVPY